MSGRTEFLVCVADAQEAHVAIDGGADRIEIVRLAATLPDVRGIVASVRDRVPVSAAPEVLGHDCDVRDAIHALTASGVAAVQLAAVAGAANILADARALQPSLHGIAAAGFDADGVADLSVLGRLAEAGFRAVIFSPATRPARRLIETPGIETLARWVEAARRRGLQVGFAGGLEPPDIPRFLALHPDVLAFRTCLCAGERRDGALDPTRVAMVRDMIPRENVAQGVTIAVDGETGATGARDKVHDKVFVRDYIVEAGVGAYRYEHRQPQRMRFNVDADLQPIPDGVADMRDVFSYDIIVDAIGLATRKHVILVERVALDVAQATLADPRVRRVRVRVEKLDIIAGSVGVEIERSR